MKKVLLLVLLTASYSTFAQKKIIDHTTYDEWKSVSRTIVSHDGKYVSYEINPHKGDGYLYIYNVASGKLDSIPRGKRAKFAGDGSFIAFNIHPGQDTLRTCELKKIKKKKWPKDSLGIYVLATDSLIKMKELSSFKVDEESGWISIYQKHNNLPSTGNKKRKRRRRRKGPQYESDGKLLTILNPSTGDKKVYKNVTDYNVSEKGSWVAFTVHRREKSEKIDSVHIHTFNTKDQNEWCSKDQYNDVGSFSFDEQESRIVFLASNDTSEVKNYSLELLELSSGAITLLADSTQSFFPEGHGVSAFSDPWFTKDGSILYFGGKELARKDPKDTLIESEKVHLDIWHHMDKELQPMQLLQKKRDERKTDLYAWHLNKNTAIKLSNDTLDVAPEFDLRGKYLFGSSNELYAHTYNWVIPYPEDHYRVSIETGEVELIKSGVEFVGNLSPSGRYYTYYNHDKHNHYLIDLKLDEEKCLSCSIDNVLWESDINGMPMKAFPLSAVRWKSGEDRAYMQSEFDIWEYDMKDGSVRSITGEIGSKNSIELRMRPWVWDSVYVDFDNYYLRGFDRKTKGVHLYTNQSRADVKFVESAYYDAQVTGLMRSKNKATIIGRKQTTVDYPDVYLSGDLLSLKKRISVANPQQKEYNWVNVELIDWMAYDSTKLEGLLYKPENYDSTKSYPLMVYFYELYTDNMHRHYIPKPTASIVYATEYASAGYVVFIPDIRYKPGHPANSAYNCILSGTDRVLELCPNIDSTRMALQGQSWGGYQTAQLVTMTNRYKAAMAGAPVTNMFSAYGGIRWGSGLNRQFQYERTQSRIGYTIWEKPELYVENSPQFHLPNVQTPLLIMHNDNDGAVPWYQGIELFTGLKRLGKTTWMLNYNEEQHNLMQDANRRDLSRRMRQFFDHYLLDEPAPEWMTHGIPAVDKGKNFGFEPAE